MAQKHNCIITNIVDDALSDNDVEVYLKLYALFYAVDTVIFAESSSEIQRALNAMSEYCRLRDLKTNSNETKIVLSVLEKTSVVLEIYFTFILRKIS